MTARKSSAQTKLIEENFETRKPSFPVYCHQDFLEKLRDDPTGKRASLLMQRLAVDPRRQHYKATMGQNSGWRRSRLGGNNGSHFYAWWAPRGAAPLKAAGFDDAPENSVFLRDIRHHDDHALLTPQSLSDNYLPLTIQDLRREEYGPSPWTPTQTRFARSHHPVLILKGHPGSGKTSALWHAADLSSVESVLYITYSRELAGLAQDYFDRYCPGYRRFRVVAFPALMRELAASQLESVPDFELRARFVRDLGVTSRTLGPWADHKGSLYEELHAHLIGEALPEKAGRFEKCAAPRLPDKSYRERRERWVGPQAAAAAADTVNWLSRHRPDFETTLFPELNLAWRATERLRDPAARAAIAGQGVLDFEVIAIDEVQDLTPIEAYALLQLAKAAGQARGRMPALLLAGDEAQTVRPTDFEWAWLNDLLHDQAATPAEFKLSANLRSPRRIAELINRVWDLYAHLSKQDRPSGAGSAEIEEDAADQIHYCTAAPGADLAALLESLADREGLAIVSMEQPVPFYVPEAIRPNVLTAAEVKGLDFHSVAILGAGKKLEEITSSGGRLRPAGGIEALGRRLAIDELRVVLSRPTERLYWIDVNPPKETVKQCLLFLNGGVDERLVSPSIPAGILRTIEEDQLDTEERVQRCQTDARQYLNVRPEMAWSRAQQAVTLLARGQGGVQDETARRTAYLTLCEVAYTLALRKVVLPQELGRPDLLDEAARAALKAGRSGLSIVIREVAKQQNAPPAERLPSMGAAVSAMVEFKDQLDSWFLIETEARAKVWLDELESAAASGRNARILLKLLPPFYGVLRLSDSSERLARLKQRSLQSLLKDQEFADALELLRELPERQPKQEAVCHEGLNRMEEAAEAYLRAGDRKEALRLYRKIPDFERTLKLLDEVDGHPAAGSLRWVRSMQKLAAERPPEFAKVMTPPEKRLLEQIMEQSLGVERKKRVVKTAKKKSK